MRPVRWFRRIRRRNTLDGRASVACLCVASANLSQSKQKGRWRLRDARSLIGSANAQLQLELVNARAAAVTALKEALVQRLQDSDVAAVRAAWWGVGRICCASLP